MYTHVYTCTLYLVEVIKLDSCHSSSNARCDGFAGVTNKVRDREDLGGFLLIVLISHLKVPGKGKGGER